jgi:hypothetical protein
MTKGTSSKYKQGKYILKNPHTYVGNPDQIYYRSQWEKMFMLWVDSLSGLQNTPIISWNSEEVKIPYFFTLDNKKHTYYVDFAMKYRHGNGEIITCLIEIKPYMQTQLPQLPKTKTQKSMKNYAIRMVEYQKNQAKWEAAREYCDKCNMEFKIITEYELGLKKEK